MAWLKLTAALFGFVACSAVMDTQAVGVDLNGPHIVLRSPQDHDWSAITVELNSYWVFKVPRLPKSKTLCVNAVAFTVDPTIQAGRDLQGVHFDPQSMKAKTVSVRMADGTPIPLSTVTEGLIKPLTPEEAVMCVGAIRP